MPIFYVAPLPVLAYLLQHLQPLESRHHGVVLILSFFAAVFDKSNLSLTSGVHLKSKIVSHTYFVISTIDSGIKKRHILVGLTISLVFFSDCENSKCISKKNIFQEIQSLGVIIGPQWRFPQHPSLVRPLCLKMD